MTPGAILVHHIAGRTRFRISGKRRESAYFARVREQLAMCPGVVSVTADQITGSVLVVHDTEGPDVVVDYARTLGLFDVLSPPAGDAIRPPAEILNRGAGQLDDWVRGQTGGITDLRSVALTGLVGAAIWQLLRGPVLPAAATLIWYALAVAANSRRPSEGVREGPTAEAVTAKSGLPVSD